MDKEQAEKIIFLLENILEQQAVAVTLIRHFVAPYAPPPPRMPNLFRDDKARA